ncbi:hypothetical protein DAEQUDRAFT_770884 [Daedalea quercina L-15889]|uniref:Uncharacterized protein n=1 Tax=Daedalea quercina L-15889 TaxID=1314783 RepID=A0A165KHC2_9APHY|nr:hypothetical protein DAEQUDRAFT_770884 [Daedalea quercina L-15889]
MSERRPGKGRAQGVISGLITRAGAASAGRGFIPRVRPGAIGERGREQRWGITRDGEEGCVRDVLKEDSGRWMQNDEGQSRIDGTAAPSLSPSPTGAVGGEAQRRKPWKVVAVALVAAGFPPWIKIMRRT